MINLIEKEITLLTQSYIYNNLDHKINISNDEFNKKILSLINNINTTNLDLSNEMDKTTTNSKIIINNTNCLEEFINIIDSQNVKINFINGNLENYSTLIDDINTKIENNRITLDKELDNKINNELIDILTANNTINKIAIEQIKTNIDNITLLINDKIDNSHLQKINTNIDNITLLVNDKLDNSHLPKINTNIDVLTNSLHTKLDNSHLQKINTTIDNITLLVNDKLDNELENNKKNVENIKTSNNYNIEILSKELSNLSVKIIVLEKKLETTTNDIKTVHPETTQKVIEDVKEIKSSIVNNINIEKWTGLLNIVNIIATDVQRLKYATNNFY